MSLEAISIPSEAPRPSARVASGIDCAHCGLPVPPEAVSAGASSSFCCAACEVAYGIIHGAGLGAYYEQRGSEGKVRPGVRGTGRSYSEYDEPSFRERYVAPSDGGARLELFLEGIHCTACVWLIERLPRVAPGVKSATLDLGRSAVTVVFDEREVAPSAVARALDGLGYPPHPSHAAQRAGERRQERALWVRLGVAGALAGNVMLMALALYSGAAEDATYALLFRWGSLILAVPSVFYCGSVFFRGALASLRTRTPHMDLPVSIGILAGFSRSAFNTLFGQGEVYFDSISVLIFLLLVGRFLQMRHHQKAAGALDLIAALAPATARLVEGERRREVPADAALTNAIVEVRADERIPVDGVVVEGTSSVDTSWLTGESLPEDVKPGDRVYAGTENAGATLLVRVESAGQGTRLGRLLESVERAQARRAPIVRLADRVAGYFVVAALGLSLVTFVLWHFIDPSRAVDHAVALLVVTCPCALGMATPLAVSVALKRAAGAGIFFKGGEFLEALAHPGTLAFDKTGTLTEGRLALAAFEGDPSVKRLLRAAESRSAHPIGRAVVAAFRAEPAAVLESVCEAPGAGISARVEGHEVKVGSAAFIGRDAHAAFDWERVLTEQGALGRPAVAVSVDGEVRAAAAFSDPVRSDTQRSLDALRGDGYEIAVLSGDQPRVVSAIAPALGPLVEAHGGMSPEDKHAWIERARARGPVVMVGDGVNDAAAMSAATVAIAVHGGAEASLAAADVFTTLPGVGKVLEAVTGARRTLGVIRRGIAFSLAYNVLGVGLCMAGYISPLVAAILMPLSSLTVVTSALKSRTFGTAERSSR